MAGLNVESIVIFFKWLLLKTEMQILYMISYINNDMFKRPSNMFM